MTASIETKAKGFRISKPSKVLYYNHWLQEVKRTHAVLCCVLYWTQQNTSAFLVVKYVSCIVLAPSKALYYNHRL